MPLALLCQSISVSNHFQSFAIVSIEIYRISSESSAKQLQTAFSLCLEMHAQWWIQRAKSTTSLAGTYFARHCDLRTPRLWDLWGSVKTIDAAMLQRDLFAKPKHQGWKHACIIPSNWTAGHLVEVNTCHDSYVMNDFPKWYEDWSAGPSALPWRLWMPPIKLSYAKFSLCTRFKAGPKWHMTTTAETRCFPRKAK